MTEQITKKIPEDAKVEYENGSLKVEKDGQEVVKHLQHALVDIEVQEDKVTFSTESDKRDVESIVKTYSSHFQNMLDGLEEPHVYKMKGVYAHFPMTIKQQGNEIHIENFMGERNPRKAKIEDNVDVQIDGEEVTLKSPDKDAVGQTAARIEQLCKKGNRDPRTFQDGIYIVEGDEE